MRATSRLLAETSKYLEPGRPTGLTGLLTHPSPRSALLYNYYTTLEKLKPFPESSVYRQSTEALTKHRLSIVESVKPAGLDTWRQRARQTIQAHPTAFREMRSQADKNDINLVYKLAAFSGDAARRTSANDEYDETTSGTADDRQRNPVPGQRETREVDDIPADESAALSKADAETKTVDLKMEPEPALTSEQIQEIETRIGAGLVEEIIQVAEAENELVDRMYESRVWEDLEVKPTEGQWAYYERDAHVAKAQAS